MLKKFGEDLVKIRESKKITINDISTKTRVHKSILEKMEGGDFSFFTTTHIRAFLKQYAKVVGIDGNELLFNYEMAKSGKYTSMVKDFQEKEKELDSLKVKHLEKSVLPEEIADDKNLKSENFEDIFEIPKKEDNPKVSADNSNVSADYSNNSIDERFKEENKPEQTEQRKKFSKSKRIKIENDNGDFDGKYYQNKGFRISSAFFKNAGIFILIVALLAGVYLLIDVIFLQKHSSKTDIIRQNFDDVVKETERKILGKRTEEEIQDSISKAVTKADSLIRAEADSISLHIVGLRKGMITVITDTLLEKYTYRETFKEGDKGDWKAKNYFFLSSGNTESFNVFLNGKKMKIDNKSIKMLKISKQGIVK